MPKAPKKSFSDALEEGEEGERVGGLDPWGDGGGLLLTFLLFQCVSGPHLPCAMACVTMNASPSSHTSGRPAGGDRLGPAQDGGPAMRNNA